MDETTKPSGNPRPRHDHERTDAKAKPIVAFAVGMAGLVVFGLIVGLIAFDYFVKHQSLGPPASPFEDVRVLPPEPRLQVDAPRDLEGYKTEQNKVLDSYGWVNQRAGIVRIPITRAMDVLLQQGFPVRKNAPESSGGLEASTSRTGSAAETGKQQMASGSESAGLRR